MRVARDGTATDIPVKTWESSQTFTNHLDNGPRSKWGVLQTETFTGTPSHSLSLISLITDSDQGVLMSWGVDERCNNCGPNTEVLVLINACVPAADEHLTRITNGTRASDVVSGHNWGNPVALDLQLEDGTFVRRRQEGGTSTAVALEATGTVKWQLSSYSPSKVVDGGLIVERFGGRPARVQNNGEIAEGVDPRPYYESWSGAGYKDSNGVVEQTFSMHLPSGASYAADLGGSPSQINTYIGFAPGPEGTRIAAFQNWGGSCKLGPDIPLLLQDSDPLAFAHYANMRSAAKDFSGLNPEAPYETGSCRAFIQYNDLLLLRDAVTNQVPYDGQKTVRSMASLGLFPRNIDAKMYAASIEGRAPVCQTFILKPGVVAISQGTSVFGTPNPPTNIYVNSNPAVYKRFLNAGTVVHEALHNSTGRSDDGLRTSFINLSGADDAAILRQSGEIDRVLIEHLCAPIVLPTSIP
jgi:hypothetical protein